VREPGEKGQFGLCYTVRVKSGVTARQRVELGLIPAWSSESEAPETVAVQERMEWLGAAGMSVAVIDGYDIAWEAGYGLADAVERTPVRSGTLFLAGSISKSVNAAGVMRLVERGELDLDRDVNEFLRSWKVPAQAGWQAIVTLRQLLSHTAGTTVHGFPGYGRGTALPTTADILDGRRPANTPPVRVNQLPGVSFRYSGGGTTIVQQLLVDVCGLSYPDLMRALVLEPAGMTSSTFEQPPPPPLVERCASGHGWYGNRIEGRWHLYPEMAAAGLWTTAGDLARFALEIQRSLRGESDLLTPDGAREMLTEPAGSSSYGLGFMLQGDGGSARFGHGGADEGFFAGLWAYRQRGQGAAVMTNSNPGTQMISEVLNGIARAYDWPGWLREAPAGDGEIDPGHAGTYQADRVRIGVRVDDTVWLEVENQPPVRLLPQPDGGYRLHGLEGSVRIDGHLLVLKQEGGQLEARRVAE